MMKRALIMAITSLTFLGSVPDQAFGQYDENTLCRMQKPGVNKYKKQAVPDGYDNVETYLLDSDFRSPSRKIPWSETKILEDPVVGSTVGVLDRNYIPNGSRIHTAWYKDIIIATGLDINPQLGVTKVYEYDVMMIPAGDSYFVLRGCNGRFPVNEELAEALRGQIPGKNIFIKLYAEGFGGGVLSTVGAGTTAEWKKVYANWSKSEQILPEELGF